MAMNQMAHISSFISDRNIIHVEEALRTNDSLCAFLLELRHRHDVAS